MLKNWNHTALIVNDMKKYVKAPCLTCLPDSLCPLSSRCEKYKKFQKELFMEREQKKGGNHCDKKMY